MIKPTCECELHVCSPRQGSIRPLCAAQFVQFFFSLIDIKVQKDGLRLFVFFYFAWKYIFSFWVSFLFFYILSNQMAHISANCGKDKRNYFPCVSCLYHLQSQTLNLRDGVGWRAETRFPELQFNCCCSTQLLFLKNSSGVLQVTCHLYCNLQSGTCKILSLTLLSYYTFISKLNPCI